MATEFDPKNPKSLLETEGFQRRMIAKETAESLLTPQESEDLKERYRQMEEFEEKYGEPQTNEADALFFEMRKKQFPGGFKVLAKVTHIEDKILEAGRG